MSCLFHSIGFHCNLSADEVRRRVVNAMQEKEQSFCEIVATAEGMPFAEYTKRMRLSSSWGGGIELEVAAELWGLTIEVVGPGSTRINVGSGSRRVGLHYTGSHYSPLRGETHAQSFEAA